MEFFILFEDSLFFFWWVLARAVFSAVNLAGASLEYCRCSKVVSRLNVQVDEKIFANENIWLVRQIPHRDSIVKAV